jgi:hypothetical protein
VKFAGALLLVGLVSPLFSAAFNATDGYINVPIAKQYRDNEIQFGFSGAYNGSASIQDQDIDRYELDVKSVYNINHRHQVGLNMVHSNKFVLHYQTTVTDDIQPYQLALGVRNISDAPYSTWNASDYVEDVNMSPYIVNTFYTEKTSFSIGYGLRQFEHPTRTLNGIGSFIENLNGVFFGFSYTEKILSFMAEYDGRDINFGLRIRPTDSYEINLALTEQLIDSDNNPQHENAPRRQITFGISSRNLFSHNAAFNHQIRKLNQKISDLEHREFKRINDQKKNIEMPVTTKEDQLKLTVIDRYSAALLKYNQRDYSGAIKDLQDALAIEPQNAAVLTRLGSVYYTYGFLDHAIHYWTKALEITPNAPELADVKAFLTKRKNTY